MITRAEAHENHPATGECYSAVVEIAPDSNGEAPVALIRSAYRAASSESIALLLSGIHPDVIDRCIRRDAECSERVGSVRYVSWENRSALVAAFSAATLLVGDTPEFMRLARECSATVVLPARTFEYAERFG